MSDSMATEDELDSDTTTGAVRTTADANRSLRWGAALLGLSGVGFLVNGLAMLYRVFFTDGFEAGVGTLGGVTRSELAATNHELAHYINHLHVNVAGLMVAAGIAMVALAWFGVRRGQQWALGTTVAIPVVFLVHSLPVHQTAGFSFNAVTHLGPGAVWLPLLFAGAVLAAQGLQPLNESP